MYNRISLILLIVCTSIGLDAATSPDAEKSTNSMTTDISRPSPKAKLFLRDAIMSGRYMLVERDGEKVTLTLETKPDMKGLQFASYVYVEAESISHHLSNSDEFSSMDHSEASLDKEMEALVHDPNSIAVTNLLNQWLSQEFILTPGEEYESYLFDATLSHLATWKRVKSLTPELQQALDDLQGTMTAREFLVSIDLWENHSDLQKFLQINGAFQAHQFHKVLQLDSQGQPMLMVNGKFESWEDIKDEIKMDASGRMEDHFWSPKDGIVNGNPSTSINIFFKEENPKYGKRYVLEVISHIAQLPDIWINLRDPEGNIYSISWKSKDSSSVDWWHGPAYHGEILSPYPLEWKQLYWNTVSYLKTPVEVSSAEFTKLLNFLQEYQKNPDACYDQKIQGASGTKNCAGFVATVLSQLGIEVPPQSNLWEDTRANENSVKHWQLTINQQRQAKIQQMLRQGASQKQLEDALYERPKPIPKQSLRDMLPL